MSGADYTGLVMDLAERIVCRDARLLDLGSGLSQSISLAMQLKAFGGNGYVYLQEVFLPRLRDEGVSEEAIRQMTALNPRRVLALD